jgi:hypothetical protein
VIARQNEGLNPAPSWTRSAVRDPAPTGAVAQPDLLAVYCNRHLASAAGGIELVEFEFLASAVRGKRSGFETLRIAADVDAVAGTEEF